MSDLSETGLTSRPVEFLDIVYHTALLRWFSEFEIDSGSDKVQHYILRAEKRYAAWLQYLKERKPDPAMVLIPPIDVILMWHTHMLSPRRYIEDMYRLTNDNSLLVYNLPLKRINTVYIRKRVPEAVDIKSWTLFTNLPYDLDMDDESPYDVACPWCDHHFEIQWLSYVDIRTSTKPRYSATCPDCQCQYSPEVASARQFWNDLTLWQNDHTKLTAVRGIILDPNTGDWDLSRAEAILEKLDDTFQELEVQPPESWSSCNWSHILRYFTAAQSLLEIRHRHEESIVLDTKQIESSYRNMVGPFSVKLWRMAAYNFQLFKRILPNFWATSEVTKRHCNKYHAYLVAMNEQDETAANTLEPDMAWLTHMLKPGHYREYMLLFTQKVVDFHDRVVSSEQLLSTTSHDDFSSQASHDSAVEFRTRTSTTNSDNSAYTRVPLSSNVVKLSDTKFNESIRARELQRLANKAGIVLSGTGGYTSSVPRTGSAATHFGKHPVKQSPPLPRKQSTGLPGASSDPWTCTSFPDKSRPLTGAEVCYPGSSNSSTTALSTASSSTTHFSMAISGPELLATGNNRPKHVSAVPQPPSPSAKDKSLTKKSSRWFTLKFPGRK